jgi:phosphomannomutase
MGVEVSVKFGTSGLRGLSVDLVGETTRVYVSAFADHLISTGHSKPGSRVYVGLDLRDSSVSMAKTALEALHSAGLIAINCGTVPTPALAYYAMSKGAASLMITGSHIPADRNGIKFYRPDGEIDKADEMNIVASAAKLSAQDGQTAHSPVQFKNHAEDVKAQFSARNQMVLPALALSGLHVGVYQHSTVARDILEKLLVSYGAIVTAFGRSDIFVPVDTEAVSEQTLSLLKFKASSSHFDAIVSADGDGDRPLVADETGMPVRGDILGLLTAEFLGAQTVVTPITSNSSIERHCAAHVYRTRVGSPYVIAAMNEAIAQGSSGVMGFEANGGVLLASPFALPTGPLAALPTRDCMIPILAVLHACKKTSQPLSRLISSLNCPVADSGRIENYPPEHAIILMNHLSASAQNRAIFLQDIGKEQSVNTLDGVRITLSDGRIMHFRGSGNAPELRCYTEANTANAARDLLERGLKQASGFTA